MKTEAYFISHCDNESCVLGSFQYTCPHCNKTVGDYDIWWKEDSIRYGGMYRFKCEYCETQLIVKWDEDEDNFLTSVSEDCNCENQIPINNNSELTAYCPDCGDVW